MGFVEGPVRGGLVANEESEVLGDGHDCRITEENLRLEANGAEGEPLIGGHLLHQDLFGGSFGEMFVSEGVKEIVEFFRIFSVKEDDAGGEAVRDGVESGLGFAFGGAWSGRTLRVFPVGCYLRWC